MPDEYWLRDTHGNKIEVWPGAWRLNLTRPDVAEFQARYAYQQIFDGNLSDRRLLLRQLLHQPVVAGYGRLGQPGRSSTPTVTGRLTIPFGWTPPGARACSQSCRTFRRLDARTPSFRASAPPPLRSWAPLFNGDSIGFTTAGVREGTRDFGYLSDTYQAGGRSAAPTSITMIEGSPPDQIAYGYDYSRSRRCRPPPSSSPGRSTPTCASPWR